MSQTSEKITAVLVTLGGGVIGGMAGYFTSHWLPLAIVSGLIALSGWIIKAKTHMHLNNRLRELVVLISQNTTLKQDSLVDQLEITLNDLLSKMTILEELRDGITLPFFIVDGDTKLVIYANQACVDFTGNSIEDSVNKMKGFQFLNYPDIESCEVCRPVAQVVIPQKRSWSDEVSLFNKKGEKLFVLATAFPILNKEEKVVQVSVFINDISVIRKSEQRRKIQYERIRKGTDTMADNISVLNSNIEDMHQAIESALLGAAQQQDAIAESNQALSEVEDSVKDVNSIAQSSLEKADHAGKVAHSGQQIVEQVVQAIGQVRNRFDVMREKLDVLDKQADDIGQVISVINDIADQTNLLALNAAIEAARAGDAGRGFAVVADEVRKLAEKTMQATGQVGEVVTSIQAGSQDSLNEMHKALEAVSQSTNLADQSGDSLREIVQTVEHTSEEVRQIARSSEFQTKSVTLVRTHMEEVEQISQQTWDGMQKSLELSGDTNKLSARQLQLIGELKRSEE